MKHLAYLAALTALLILPGSILAADAPAGPPPAKVVVAPAQEKVVAESTPIVGTLYFDRVSDLSTEVSGLVKSITVQAGDRVRAGDVLAVLNTDFVDQETALVQTRIAQLDVQIEQAEKDLKRYEALYRQDAASEKAYDDIVFSRRNLSKQREALANEMQTSRLKKAKSTIKAPFDGLVLEKRAEAGDWVGSGGVFCRLAALDALCAQVPIAEELLNFSRKGDSVAVTVNAFQQNVSGVIDGFLPVADSKTKNIMLKIRLPRMDRVAENMSATVRVPVSEPKQFMLVPRDALVNFQGQEMVYLVKDGKAVPAPVRVVGFVNEFAAVESQQVTAGAPLVVDGGARLRPDQPVEIVQ